MIRDVRPEAGAEALESAIGEAQAALARGELVVMPTDTVYGLAADARQPEAVRRLLAAKHRGRDMPPPVLIDGFDRVKHLAKGVSKEAKALARAFWPGGLTLVLPVHPRLGWDLGDLGETIAVRMPDHPVALALLARTGPLAVSSANLSGQPPARTAAEAAAQLGDAVALILDAGPSGEAPASTVVDACGASPRVLRPGTIGLEDLRRVAPDVMGWLA
jgi:tRNA threonylcarbamoyl adenosine modification protein (Sua5/YciO/YrdC/YwlC family)